MMSLHPYECLDLILTSKHRCKSCPRNQAFLDDFRVARDTLVIGPVSTADSSFLNPIQEKRCL